MYTSSVTLVNIIPNNVLYSQFIVSSSLTILIAAFERKASFPESLVFVVLSLSSEFLEMVTEVESLKIRVYFF
jgi:hypothetical protein